MLHWFWFMFGAKRPRMGMAALTGALSLPPALGLILTETGCTGSIGTECTLNSQCDEGLVCALGYCHVPCKEPEDCDHGQFCFQNREPNGSTVFYCAEPVACEKTTDCRENWTCHDNQCRTSCKEDADCPPWQECVSFQDKDCGSGPECILGACRDRADRPTGDAGWPSTGENGSQCQYHSQCASKNCSNWTCIGCEKDFDCGPGRACLRTNISTGECVESTTGGDSLSCGMCATAKVDGAFAKACNGQAMTCFNDTECAKLFACAYNCPTNGAGACCTRNCVNFLGTPVPSQSFFYTLSKCVYCDSTTCKTPCEPGATAYCAAIESDGGVGCQ